MAFTPSPFTSPFDFVDLSQEMQMSLSSNSSSLLSETSKNLGTSGNLETLETLATSETSESKVNPPSYESVYNGTVKTFPLNNTLSPHQSIVSDLHDKHSVKGPPPGLEHVNRNVNPKVIDNSQSINVKNINMWLIQNLRSEISNIKEQLLSSSLNIFNEKFDKIDKMMIILEKMI
jgi:hypothetical protein